MAGMERAFPEAAPSIAPVAAVLADTSRAAMCTALMGGRAWTPGDLAKLCGIACSTVTEHLHRLAEAGITADIRQGKHRYVTLASADVAELLERLAVLSGKTLWTPPSLSAADRTRRFNGADLTSGVRHLAYLDDRWHLTDAGMTWAEMKTRLHKQGSFGAAV